MRLFFTILILLSLTTSAFAANNYTGKIVRILSAPTGGLTGKILITVDGDVQNKPSCSSNGYDFAFDATTPAGMVTLSTLMAAYSNNATVTFYGLDSCSVHGNTQDLYMLLIRSPQQY